MASSLLPCARDKNFQTAITSKEKNLFLLLRRVFFSLRIDPAKKGGSNENDKIAPYESLPILLKLSVIILKVILTSFLNKLLSKKMID